MAERLENTPNGCRIDNGRCFDRLEWEPETQSVAAYFHDGSEYRYFGLDADQVADWLGQLDPGCWFNHRLWPGTYIRTKPPD